MGNGKRGLWFILSMVDFLAGLGLRFSIYMLAKLVTLKISIRHKLSNILYPNVSQELAFAKQEIIKLKMENWVLKHRSSNPRNSTLCLCGKARALYYDAINSLMKLKSSIGFSERTIKRYQALLKRGITFLIPKSSRTKRPRTPADLTNAVWLLHDGNPDWGRWRIAFHIWRLGTFISPSTVRNILLRPQPHSSGHHNEKIVDKPEYKPFLFAKGIWGMDFTSIRLWNNKVAHIFAVIELTSRKVLCVKTLLYSPDSAWIVEALKEMISQYGSPLTILTDNGGQFRGKIIENFCAENGINRRFTRPRRPQTNGRIERFFGSLKSECLNRTFFMNVNDVDKLCKCYVGYYNTTRPHHALDGATPNEIFYKREWQRPDKDEKYLNGKVKKKFFCDGLITSYYLEKVA